MENLTYQEFLKLFEQKSEASVSAAFGDFRQRMESKHGLRIRFVLQSSQLSLKLNPLRPQPWGADELIPTVAFAVAGKRSHGKVGVCFTMKSTGIELRKHAYPPRIADGYYAGLRKIDSRLTVGTPLDAQLPLRDLNAGTLSKLETVIDDLIATLDAEPNPVLTSSEFDLPDAATTPNATSTGRPTEPNADPNTASRETPIDVDIVPGAMRGFIYILTNAAMRPECLKIGVTTRTPEERAGEISRGTGVPCPFTVAFEIQLENCFEVERVLHRMLSKHRIQSNREFFFLPLKDAIRIIQEVADAQSSTGGE